MSPSRALRSIVAVALAWAVTASAAAFAPNEVEITPALVTSGQPSREALATLGAARFGAVIYLAPATVSDAVPDEAAILARQSIAFANVPIDFAHPTDADYEAFAAALAKVADRKVLVHCQINLRASSMVFLYRVIALREAPHEAYADVNRVWVPNATWRRYLRETLAKRGVAFDPY